MHTYLLTFFERLLRDELKQKQDGASATTDWNTTIINIRYEKSQFLDAFSQTLFKASEVNQFVWRVRIYQQKIVILLDQVEEMMRADKQGNVARFSHEACYLNVLNAAHSSLEEMLNFIKRDFGKYLDENTKIPVSHQLVDAQKIKSRLYAINDAFGKSEATPELVTIMLLPFHEFLAHAPYGNISYRHMSYLNTLLGELEELPAGGHRGVHIDELIHTRLREMNFNHPRYFAYCTVKIREELDELAQKDQLEHLIRTLKSVDQVQQRPGVIFTSLQDNVQQQLRTWINAEIHCLKELSLLPGANTANIDGGRWQGFKIATIYSVPQLGHAIRLFYDTGIFKNENVTEMMDFFSKFFTSANQENISAGSLRKHFYSTDNATMKAVRDKLILMLNHSKKTPLQN